jgi:hypothetical protein
MRLSFRQLPGLGLVLLSLSAIGQDLRGRPPLPATSSLRLLARNAGYIFDGTVLSVQRVVPNEIGNVATVQITFRVEQAMRGTRAGQVLTIREWAGLWDSGERYRPGQRLLLFLYSPSKLGLTSPVGGPSGRFAVDPNGNALIENGRLPELALDSASQTLLHSRNRVNARALALAIQRADAE